MVRPSDLVISVDAVRTIFWASYFRYLEVNESRLVRLSKLVDPSGIEPLTSSLPARRSPS